MLALSASAHASPSFSCHRATWLDEVAICQNVQLAALDRQLAELYAMAMDIYKGGFKTHVQHTQREWLNQRHGCGIDAKCIDQMYANRLASLGDGDIANADWCHEGEHMSDVDCKWVRSR